MSTNDDQMPNSPVDNMSSPKTERPPPRRAKPVHLQTPTETNGTRIEAVDSTAVRSAGERRGSFVGATGATGDSDHATELNFMKAKMMDLEAKLASMQFQPPMTAEDPKYLNGDYEHVNTATDFNLNKEPPKARVPAIPQLNRITWVPFKNLYPDEPVYAVDVLVGPPKFYWQRRAEEREMKDRIEAAKNYNAENKERDLVKAKEKAEAATANGHSTRPAHKELPERIRINSKPVLAILADLAGEKWTDEPKVFLRPYKLLVVYEDEIRKRLEVLQKIWSKRPKPDDVTTAAMDVVTYEPETVDDWDRDTTYEDSLFHTRTRERRNSDSSFPSSHGRRVRLRVDLTTTYDALQDLGCLIKFMDEELCPVVKQYSGNSTYPKVYFRDLWYLFRPGEWVVLDERKGKRFSPDAGPEDDRPPSQPANLGERAATIWRVLRTADGRPKLAPPSKDERNRPPSKEVNPFCVRCYRIDYDGDRFGPIWVDFDFHPWEGERMIEQLDIVPLRLTKDAVDKRERYVSRGKQFMELRAPQHRLYSGPLLNFHPSGLLFEHISPGQRDVYGSVIVDFKETARVNPKMMMKLGFSDVTIRDEDLTTTEDYPLYVWKDRKAGHWMEMAEEIYEDSHWDEHLRHKHIRRDPFLSRFDNLLQGDYIDGSDFGDDEYALLPNRVCAYILQRRRFALLKLYRLRPLKPESQNWDDLYLARDNKETVRAQTMSHFRNKRLRAIDIDAEFDLNREKGLGLIILLHGVPGVGKTSTAECVAQLLGKPLFPITCGDLGTTAEQVEQQLYEIFSKAEKWDCVLLLDEADVFLASRGKNDLKRNAVVSVFLRILEFYTGILFLTTNRTGVLDEAFMSRIHTQLYYPPLDEQQSIKIWETNLRKLQSRKGATMHVNMDEIMHFAQWHFRNNASKSTGWNGRQIRNACQTAAALAEHEALVGGSDADGAALGFHTPPQGAGAPLPVARLDVKHFRKVDVAVREFHEYMTDVCGDDYAGVARMRNERADDYQPPARYAEHFSPDPGASSGQLMHHPQAGQRPDVFSGGPGGDVFRSYSGPMGGYGQGQQSGGGGGGGYEFGQQQHARPRWSSFSGGPERPHY